MGKELNLSKITVIIPVYNMQAYIKDTLTSLETQCYKDFEVIIIDDGSTDNSNRVINDYIRNSKLRVRYYRQENKGVSAARNYGLDLCSTEFVFFLDADDTIPDYTLELIISYASSYDVVCGITGRNCQLEDKRTTIHEGMDFLLNDYLFKNTKYQFCSFLYKKRILKDYSIRFSEDLKYGEDEEFAWKYLCHCQSAITLDKVIYYYRENLSSASHNLTLSRTQVIDTMKRVSNYYEKNHHPFLKQLIQYGIPKAKLSILKQFAVNKKVDLYNTLRKSDEYNCSLISLLGFPDYRIKIAAAIYLLSPSLFYRLVH